MRDILIATRNAGKLEEYKLLLADLPARLLSLSDIGITEECEETGVTFEENAISKAEFYFARAGALPVIADDGGFEIDYLNGEPGVYSRRWLGREASDLELVSLALEKMHGAPQVLRGAQFRAVTAFKSDARTAPIVGEGTLRGTLACTASDTVLPGLPFRSIFLLPGEPRVMSEMPIGHTSHRHRRESLEKIMPALRRMYATYDA